MTAGQHFVLTPWCLLSRFCRRQAPITIGKSCKDKIYQTSMPRAGLEPARPFGPEDFPTTITFATCRSFQARQFVVWTMPSPCMFHCLL